MKNAIYLAASHDCAANLAGEAYLLTLEYDHILFLWVNDPCIVIGRYQNPFAECNLKNMEEDKVQLVRRQSGGGAVYHDQGNLCFTLIGNKHTTTKEENFALVLKALASLGLECELSGRNDILLNGKKISGNAFQTTATKFCHHGNAFGQQRPFGDEQLPYPPVRTSSPQGCEVGCLTSGKLKEGRADITNEMVQAALVDAFNAAYGHTEVQPIDFKTLPQAQENYHRFGDLSVILEKTPQFTHSFTHRFEWGEATLHLQVEKGIISEVRMFTDALDTSIVDRTIAILGNVPYSHKALEELHKKASKPILPACSLIWFRCFSVR